MLGTPTGSRDARDPEELVDASEVVDALVEQVGRAEVDRLREQKATERGRFDDGIVLRRVETDGEDCRGE